MRLSRPFAAMSAVAATAALTLGGAVAAQADDVPAAIPAGQTLYGIEYQQNGGDLTSQLVTIDADGTVHLVGELEQNYRAWAADWDPTTGIAYFFDDVDGCMLYSLDLATATETFVGEMLDIAECDGLDIDADGVLRILEQGGLLHVVNKTTAAVESTHTISGEGGNAYDLASLATAADGRMVIADYADNVFLIDTTTWAATRIDEAIGATETSDFDATGRLWSVVRAEGDACIVTLSSADVSDAELGFAMQGPTLRGDTCSAAWAIFFVDEPTPEVPAAPVPATPALAETGIELNAVGAASAVLLLAGLLLVVVRRRSAGTPQR